MTKTVWREPFAWMEGQRSTSPRLPGGSVVGGPVTGAFCGAVVAATDLTHLASRQTLAAGTLKNTPQELAAWIADPQKHKPGTNMPATPLSKEDLDALVAYLGSLT